jgi:hypothetical protein
MHHHDKPTKRKRARRKAEATAKGPGTCGGWGQGVPTSLSDLVLLRRAVNEGWPVPDDVRQAIVGELATDLASSEVRRVLSIARVFLAMDRADLRAAGRLLRERRRQSRGNLASVGYSKRG